MHKDDIDYFSGAEHALEWVLEKGVGNGNKRRSKNWRNIKDNERTDWKDEKRTFFHRRRILMTIDEFNLYKKRLYSLLEKGIEVEVENKVVS